MRTVLLPVKEFAQAKQRLSGVLTTAQRAMLARAMLSDVLRALSAARFPQRVVVFTASEAVIGVVRPFNFAIADEVEVLGHSAAVNRMVEELSESSTQIMSIASDLPMLTAEDVDRAFTSADREINLISSRDGTGTNAAVFTSPARIRMEYGEGSLARHLSRAAAAGFKAGVLRAPGIEFDIDTPEDLQQYRQQGPADSLTWRLVSGWIP